MNFQCVISGGSRGGALDQTKAKFFLRPPQPTSDWEAGSSLWLFGNPGPQRGIKGRASGEISRKYHSLPQSLLRAWARGSGGSRDIGFEVLDFRTYGHFRFKTKLEDSTKRQKWPEVLESRTSSPVSPETPGPRTQASWTKMRKNKTGEGRERERVPSLALLSPCRFISRSLFLWRPGLG